MLKPREMRDREQSKKSFSARHRHKREKRVGFVVFVPRRNNRVDSTIELYLPDLWSKSPQQKQSNIILDQLA